MSDDFTPTGEGRQLLAAEYVLGVLDAAQRDDAKRLLVQDPAFAAEVTFWEERLGGLTSEVTPVVPPAHVWNRINTALAPAARPGGLWNSLRFWRWSAVASAALAAASTCESPSKTSRTPARASKW